MNFKVEVYNTYSGMLQSKIEQQEAMLKELSASAANETKSTAGDKHETALAMLQLEQENTRRQLKELLTQKALLLKIDPLKHALTIVNGSLVKTDKGYFYISIALGKTVIANNTIYALSPNSPLGKKLMGCSKGDTAEVNGAVYQIISIE